MRTRTKVWLVAVAIPISSLFLPSRSSAQVERPWVFPSELRPALESRLRLFTQAQAEGRWHDVALLLGRYRRGFSGYKLYTPAHKACFVSQMRTSPMIAFTFTIQESPFSSEILSTPATRRWWVLVGEGVFLDASGKVKRQSWVTAYRDRGDWYFTPSFDDDAWARVHLTAKELSADYKDRVELRLAPDCPLEIVELHVFIDAEHLSSRPIEFRLRNKTAKRVTGYCFEIADERHDGSISVGTGAPRDAIEPGGVSRRWEEDYAAYLYWCEGEAKMYIEVQSVNFADGTTWNAPGFPPGGEEDK